MSRQVEAELAQSWESRVDLTQPVAEICQRLGLDETYVGRLDITPGKTTVELYLGKEGRCRGPKYIDLETGKTAMETLTFDTRS